MENAFFCVARELKSRYETGCHLQAGIVDGEVILGSRRVHSKWDCCG